LGLVALLGLASLSLAQTTTQDVQINIPSFFTITFGNPNNPFEVGNRPLVFDFVAGSPAFGDMHASYTAYQSFLQGSTSSEWGFMPSISQSSDPYYHSITINSNQASWVLAVRVQGNLPAPLSNDRLRVSVENLAGNADILVLNTPLPFDGDLPLVRAVGNGIGTSAYRIYYLLFMRKTDVFPTNYDAQITVTYVLTAQP